MASKYNTVTGMMSGTSLDGMDLVLCRFYKNKTRWQYQILHAVTLEYPAAWKKKLREAATLPAKEFLLLHNEYGRYTGDAVTRFLNDTGLRAGLVASHGHTIFHQPGNQLTFQLGAGAAIAAQCGITTVSDFR